MTDASRGFGIFRSAMHFGRPSGNSHLPELKPPSRLATLALSLMLTAGVAHAQSIQRLASFQGEDRQKLLVEGAKKEGSLTFYTTIPADLVGQLVDPFEQKYGIKVNVWRTRSELILQRVLTEARAGKHVADVINAPTVVLEAVRREKLLQAVHSPYHKDLIAGVVPEHREWATISVSVRVQAYNTKMVRKDELPKTYEELLNPKWKGKLAIEANSHEWVSSVVNDMGQAKGVKFFGDLASSGMSVRAGYPLLTGLVASGEVPIALTVLPHSVEDQKRKGAPIEWFVIKEPAIGTPGGVVIPKNTSHPHAALLFYDFMLSPEGMTILSKIGYIPTSLKAESPMKNLKYTLLDPGHMLDEEEKSFNQFKQIMAKGAAR